MFLDVRSSVDKGVSTYRNIRALGFVFFFSCVVCFCCVFSIFSQLKHLPVAFPDLCSSFLFLTEKSDLFEKRLLLHRYQRDTFQVCPTACSNIYQNGHKKKRFCQNNNYLSNVWLMWTFCKVPTVFLLLGSKYSFFFNSLGIVLSRGYGQYIFTGNVSVEEGKSCLFTGFVSASQTVYWCFFNILLQVFTTYWLQIWP